MSELWNACMELFTEQGVSPTIAVFYIVTTLFIGVMAIVALIMKLIVFVRYHKGNCVATTSGKNSFEIAEEALNRCGLNQVKVKKAGFLRSVFFGNSYSLNQKTVFLRRNIAEKNSITAVALALQKVGIARLCESGDKTARTRNRMQVLNIFTPVLFVPSVLIGIVIDILLFQALRAFSVIGIAIGLFFVLTGFIATLLTLPVEAKANKMALAMIDETGVLTEDECTVAKQIFSAYLIAYVCEFIIAILRLIQWVLKVIISIQSANNKK